MRCIVCEKSIKKKLHYFNFLPPQEAVGCMKQKIPARKEGEIIHNMNISTIFTDHPPASKSGCSKFTNFKVMSATITNGAVRKFSAWDGETYADDYFCSDKCAIKQGYASAQHNARYCWK